MALLFLNPGEEALIGYTAQYITTLGAFFFPLALVNILRFSIQGMGFSNLAILAGVMEMFARMGVATLLVPAIGYTGACFASPAAWVCATSSSSPPAFGASPTSAGSMDSPRSAPAPPSCNLLPDPWRASPSGGTHLHTVPPPDTASACRVRGYFLGAAAKIYEKGLHLGPRSVMI